MSILLQQNDLLKGTPLHHHHVNKTNLSIRVRPAAIPSRTKSNPSSLVNKSNPASPSSTPIKTANKSTSIDPDSRSTWSHQAWVASGCIAILFSLAKSIATAFGSHIWARPILATLIGYILADLVSGVYHWAIDNYGDGKTPIVGGQIEAFQGHHKLPWLITQRQFANKLHSLARGVTFTLLPFNLILNDPTLIAFFGSLAGFLMFSQQFHAWAHTPKGKLPKIVVGLQDLGVLLSRAQHAAHHRLPYDSNYCIVSGIWNKLLDGNKVFERLELLVFSQFGVKPRSWSGPSSEWIEESSPMYSSEIAQ